MSIFKARGIILKENLVGDMDKSLVVLLKDYGKFNIWARNSRSSKSKLLAGSSIFSYADFIIYDNGKSLSLNQIDIIKTFYTLTEDLDTLAYSTYFLEFIEKNVQEQTSVNDIMLLLLKSLYILSKETVISPRLIAKVFEIKYLQLSGYMPMVNNCCHCRKNMSDEIEIFWGIRGSVCASCKHLEYSPIKVSKNLLYTINYILSSSLDNLYKFSISEELLQMLSIVSKKLLNEYLCVNLKSKSFIEEIEKLI